MASTMAQSKSTSQSSATNAVASAVSLRSSPYSFSQPGNFFAAVGCNNLAVMAETASAVIGCTSHCDGGGLGNFSNCSGVGCCRTLIPLGLWEFDVKFKWISDDDTVAVRELCRLAFLADKQWVEFNELKDLRMLREMEYVPGVLEWGIPKEMVSVIGLSGGDSYGCEYYGEPKSEQLPKLYRCYCRSGYVGNAYLADCQASVVYRPNPIFELITARGSSFHLHDGAGNNVCVPLAMVVHLLFRSILFLTFLLHNASAQATASLAKPVCSQYCRIIAIPFPFRIGENCYLNKWFEIKCDFEGPFLASVGLERSGGHSGEWRLIKKNKALFASSLQSYTRTAAVWEIPTLRLAYKEVH
ncbi:hypothetical protein NL676_017019 [Syzygium grande]|nr:hypothetical protein NL676_017019 [Syzygium grande]